MKPLLLFCAFLAISASILLLNFYGKNNPTRIHRAMYVWADSENYTPLNLERNGIHNAYYHIADIGWSEAFGAHPIKKNYHSPKEDMINIPVFYIENNVFKKTDTSDLHIFCANLVSLAGQAMGGYEELQVDCDWTTSTRDNYFFFLKTLKQKLGDKKLSATLRLHQYKNRKDSGIPPVDAVMLMLYHTSSITHSEPGNSIYEESAVASYVNNVEHYPVPIHFALPAFSWIKCFRSGKLQFLENEMPFDYNDVGVFQQSGDNTYRILKDTVVGLHYYREGDVLKRETCSGREVLSAASFIHELSNQPQTIAALFDYHSIYRDKWSDVILDTTIIPAFNAIH